MQVAVMKRDLLRVVGRCQGVADRKSTMPVLGNVLLEVVGPDALRLAATDLNLSVTGRVAAEVQRGGSVAVGARELAERVRAMPEGQLVLSVAEGGATLRSSTSARRYTLNAIPGEDFPAIAEPAADAAGLSLRVDVLSTLIARTHYSISTDDTRPHLNSALFEWDGTRVIMVSTDGHRLSKMELPVPGSPARISMLVPLRGIQELRRLCDEVRSEGKGDAEAAQEITLVKSGPSAFFRLPGMLFGVKLVEAQFPAYQQVIPTSAERVAVASRSDVIDALRAVKLAASDRTGGVKLSLSRGVMRFASESPDAGEGFDEVASEYDGADVTIGFNAQYVLDVLGALDCERIEFGLGGELDPVVLRPSSSSDFLAVVMPMRI